MLDQPWKIGLVVVVLAVLRLACGLWRRAPGRQFMLEVLDSGLIAVVLVFVLVRPFVVQAFYIPTGSMEPHLMPGDRILVNKFIYRLNDPRRGDIVVFRAPKEAVGPGAGPGQQRDFVKRLIGLPGDRIHIRRGQGVFVNGRLLAEPPGVPRPSYDWPLEALRGGADEPYRVPAGSYFVLGDNRDQSRDSHAWLNADGTPHPFVEAERLRGKAMVIFWPPGRIRLVGDHRDLHLGRPPQPAAGRPASP